MKKVWIVLVLLVLSGFTMVENIQAALITYDGSEVTGATGIDVGGTLYDVTFQDGTCVALFSGCDETSDFDFTHYYDAYDAAVALYDQVFVANNLHDTLPYYVRGLDPVVGQSWGYIMTTTSPNWYNVIALTNAEGNPICSDSGPGTCSGVNPNPTGSYQFNRESVGTIIPEWDTSGSNYVYAIWAMSSTDPDPTSVPEPSTLGLLGLGLIGLRLAKRKQAA